MASVQHTIQKLDDLDRAIIAELSGDGRISNLELSRRIGLTPAPCMRRVRRLQAIGVIEGYRAVLNPKASGRGFEVIVGIDIAVNDGQAIEEFETAVAMLTDVVEIRRMFGEPDYYLRILVADHEQYDVLTLDKLSRLPAVRRLTSHQTMRLLKG
ncbi:Lrp/AsnC family transcriptional regulator [Rhodococcus sp. ARC_M8]|uniref:Lrp/AsnC family transcriptional regulator n=1 Tax=Rhodococcus sp. ARC_M8 TaxID=2928853 RepID=UPI001FB2FE60|nr:Lrp/AsnC family transcriptional regulator [Rhodococcus sp. ARC_M8]MCJ0949978.1 Lrp/AsnC family transcriptional regulator [Rhodococcus sp. ARC_M8]